MKLRAHVVVRLGHACIDRGHPAFYSRVGESFVPKAEVTELKRRFEELTYQRYPLSLSEAALPETSRQGEVPAQILKQCREEPVLKASRSKLHADKLQTPAPPMTEASDAFTNVRPNIFSGATTSQGTRSHTEAASDAFAS